MLPDLLTGAAAALLQALSLSLSAVGHVFYAAAWLCWGVWEVVSWVIVGTAQTLSLLLSMSEAVWSLALGALSLSCSIFTTLYNALEAALAFSLSAMAWVFHAATGGAQVLFRGAVAVIYFTGECLSLISSLSYSLVSSLLATGYSVLEAAVDIAPSAVEYGYDMVISVSSVLFRAGAAVITFISSSISVMFLNFLTFPHPTATTKDSTVIMSTIVKRDLSDSITWTVPLLSQSVCS